MKRIFVFILSIFLISNIASASIFHQTKAGFCDDKTIWLENTVPTENDELFLNNFLSCDKKFKKITFETSNNIYGNYKADVIEIPENVEISAGLEVSWPHNIRELNIETEKFINKGKILKNTKLKINGNLINYGKIEIPACFEFTKNDSYFVNQDNQDICLDFKDNKIKEFSFYGQGSENISLHLYDTPEIYFKNSLKLKSIYSNKNQQIVLDENKIFWVDTMSSNEWNFSNQNKIILNKNTYSYSNNLQLLAENSDLYILDNVSTKLKIKAKNIFVKSGAQLTVFDKGIVEAENIYIEKGGEVRLSGNNVSKPTVRGKIYNYGKISISSNYSWIIGELNNFGEINRSHTTYDRINLELSKLFNYSEGKILIPKTYLSNPNNQKIQIFNQGEISRIEAENYDIEILNNSITNFLINTKNLYLNQDFNFTNRVFVENIYSIDNQIHKIQSNDYLSLNNAPNYHIFVNSERGVDFKNEKPEYQSITFLKDNNNPVYGVVFQKYI